MKRRFNNEGSIYKTKDGYWRAQISIEGERIGHAAKTFEDCKNWLDTTKKQIEEGLSYQGANILFRDYMKTWLEMIKENRRPKTYFQYQDLYARFLENKFGKMKIKDIKPILVEAYLTSIQKDGVGDRTAQLLYSILHTAFANALKKGLVGRNPIDAVNKPKIKSPRKKVLLDSSQVQLFLIATSGERLEALYHLAIASGMRQGEILGLYWSDIDFYKNTIKIQRQIQRIPRQGLVFSPPKTETGNRIISIGESTLEQMKKHKQRQKFDKEYLGDRWKESELVFTSTIGTPIDPKNLNLDFKRVLRKAGLPNMRFHDLRHSSITILLNEIGVPIKVAQSRSGHTRPSTTIDIYGGDISNKMDRSAAQQLDELITPIAIKLHSNCTEEESNKTK